MLFEQQVRFNWWFSIFRSMWIKCLKFNSLEKTSKLIDPKVKIVIVINWKGFRFNWDAKNYLLVELVKINLSQEKVFNFSIQSFWWLHLKFSPNKWPIKLTHHLEFLRKQRAQWVSLQLIFFQFEYSSLSLMMRNIVFIIVMPIMTKRWTLNILAFCFILERKHC